MGKKKSFLAWKLGIFCPDFWEFLGKKFEFIFF
jgi:hypothetical protein